ncbi:PorV/PorQ family protein [bacterium]|nr:PorV/PorQ family protein [bacterium]
MRKIKTHIIPFILILIMLPGISSAAQEFFSILGGQRVGTSAMAFLKIPVGARGEALGGAYVALANDPMAVYWNPAGIAQIGNRWNGKYVQDPTRPPEDSKGQPGKMQNLHKGNHTFGAIRTNWIAEINYDALSYIQPLPIGVMGVSLASLSTADMEITTEYHPDGTGEYFSYGDNMLALSYALAMTDNFSWGVSLKYASEQLGEYDMDAVMVDFGTYYWTGFRDLRIGVAFMHFGPNMSPDGSYIAKDENGDPEEKSFQEYSPPTEFRLGCAMTLLALDDHKFLGSFQLNHPVDNSENMKLGMEYGFMGVFFLRGGYKINTDEDRWSTGAGLRIPVGSTAFSADFAYTDFGVLQNVTRLSIGLEF